MFLFCVVLCCVVLCVSLSLKRCSSFMPSFDLMGSMCVP